MISDHSISVIPLERWKFPEFLLLTNSCSSRSVAPPQSVEHRRLMPENLALIADSPPLSMAEALGFRRYERWF